MKLKNLVVILVSLIFVLPLLDTRTTSQNYIIQFATAAVNRNKIRQHLAGCQGDIIRSYAPGYSKYRWYEIRINQPDLLPRIIKKLREEYQLTYVAPVTPVKLSATANDPYFLTGQQNYFKRLGIEAAWNNQAGSDRIKVAVIDTGIDSLHPDINNIFLNKKEIPFDSIDNDNNGYVDDIRGWNFINENNYTDDDNGHGTHVAGIIGATTNNQIGIAGAAGGGFEIDGKKRRGVILIPLKTANKRNQHGSNIVIAKAVDLAVNYGAKIINLSLQTTAINPIEKDPLYQSLSQAARQGVILIAASGNTDDPHYANLDNWSHYNLLTNHPDVIAVTATEVI